jgi:methoxymalonate biosynthesis protein
MTDDSQRGRNLTEPANRHRLAVIGAGVMGTGIAALAVGSGVPVVLVDNDEGRLDAAGHEVRGQVRTAQLLGRLGRRVVAGDLTTSGTITAVSGATAVVEAVVEIPRVKYSVLAEVARLVPAGTPILSNTSAIPITELAAAAGRPTDVVGVHFMNPAYLIPAIEVIRTKDASDAVLTAVLDLLAVLGRQPVVVGDGPGFVINRVLQRTINDAARLVSAGTASARDVDMLFEGCLGHPSGPLATADLIGLDNVVDTLRVLHERTGDDAYRPCDLLLSLVDSGHHGRKTGHGFHDYGEQRYG